MDFLSKIDFSAAMMTELLFFVVAILALIMSCVLFFHWRKYSMSGPVLAITEVVYLVVTVILLASAFFTLQ